MGKRRYKKHKRMSEDYASIKAAGKKRGLWGSIGSTLLGGLAMLATGGAAAPVVAGLMAAGGSFAGGHIGNWLAGKTKGGKLKGTKWYGSLGEELGTQIKEGINVKALKSGFSTMLMAGGGTKAVSKLFGKGGSTVTPSLEGVSGTNKLAGYTKGLFKGGPKGDQTGFGSLIDFEGSTLYSGMNKLGSMLDTRKIKKLQVGEGLVPTGQGDMVGTGTLPRGKGGVPDLDQLFAEELELPAIEGIIDQDVARAGKTEVGIFDVDLEDGGSWTPPGVKSKEPFYAKTQSAYDVRQNQISGMQDFLSDPKNVKQYGKQLYEEGGGISPLTGYGDVETTRDLLADVATPQTSGYQPQKESLWDKISGDFQAKSDLKLAKRGFNLEQPNVPVALENEFFTGNNYPLADTDFGFSTFDESSWAEGERTLSNIDYDLANKNIPWKNRFFPSNKSGKPGGFDPRY